MKQWNLSGISLDAIRAFLLDREFRYGGGRAGHEVWMCDRVMNDEAMNGAVTRPVILRTGIDPVPEFVVRNLLRVLKVEWVVLEAFLMRNLL